jgi:hypothetical protein
VALVAVERRQNGLFMALNTEILTFYLILGTKFSVQFLASRTTLGNQ